MGKGLSEDELKALVNSEMRQSMGYNSSKLSAARQKAQYYYLGLPVGDLSAPEIDGRSSVVSTDVRDTIEAMLPQLMVTFCGGNKVAEFEAQKSGDEDKARLATEYINYLFFKKNNGHQVSYTFLKDALLQKNGIVKVWWDTRHEEKKEEYKALNEVELAQVMDDPEVEVTEQVCYDDEDDMKQRSEALEQMGQQLQQAMQAAQQGNPQAQQAVMQMQQQMTGLQNQPPAKLYDITCKRVKTEGKVTVENVPPEEFLISRSAKNIQDARFVGHRVRRTRSELKSMGYKNVDEISSDDNSQAFQSMERIQRLSINDENAYMSGQAENSDDSQKVVWVCEAYVRCDFDGDGISELRKVTMAGDRVLDNEEVDFIPFVSITPVPLPHTFFGLSIADLAMESQKTKTSILRSQLDNMYLSVNGRYFAVEGQVNLDDLLTSRPGGVVRMKQTGMAGNLDTARGNAGEAQNLMGYMQQDLENRTGWSRQSMGNDASGLNTTATAANIVTNKADMRIDLIARNFASGFTELFQFMLKLVCQHQDKKNTIKVVGEWVDMDPREWRNGFDVTINVGIGMGNKDQKVQHMLALIAQQEKVFPLGVTNAAAIYESSTEFANLLGFKNGGKFFSDPTKNPPAPKPDPEQGKMQGMIQLEQLKIQGRAQADEAKMQMDSQIEQMKIQFQAQAAEADRNHEAQLEQMKMRMQAEVNVSAQQAQEQQRTIEQQNDAQLNQLKAQNDMEIKLRDNEFNRWKAQLDAETKVLVAQIGASKNAEMPTSEQPTNDALVVAMQGFSQALGAMNQPRTIVRGPDGRAQGIV